MIKKCALCQTEFVANGVRRKYCSSACHDKSYWTTRICKCGKKFKVRKYLLTYGDYRHGLFCSRRCATYYKYEDRYVERNCSYCGIDFKVTKNRLADGRGKYCSKICSYRGRIKNERACPRCGKSELVKNFHGGYCKICYAVWQKENYKAFKDKYGISLSVYRRGRSVEDFIDHLHQKAKKRAKQASLCFSITRDYLIKLFDDQDGKCAITNIPMTFKVGNGRVNTNISIDRIDSNKGYTDDNIWLVCTVVNLMKLNFTMQNFIDYCEAAVRFKRPELFINDKNNA